MNHVASQRIPEQKDGPVTIECTKSPLPVEVIQGYQFNELHYEVDAHNTSFHPTCIKNRKYSRLGSGDQINQCTF